jgi:hypothetical protein
MTSEEGKGSRFVLFILDPSEDDSSPHQTSIDPCQGSSLSHQMFTGTNRTPSVINQTSLVVHSQGSSPAIQNHPKIARNSQEYSEIVVQVLDLGAAVFAGTILVWTCLYAGQESSVSRIGILVVSIDVVMVVLFAIVSVWVGMILYFKTIYVVWCYPISFWVFTAISVLMSVLLIALSRFDTRSATPLFYIACIPGFLGAGFMVFGIFYFTYMCIYHIRELPHQLW